MARFLLIAVALLLPRLCLASSWTVADWETRSCSAEPDKFATDFLGHTTIEPYGTPSPRPPRPAAEVETYYFKFNGWSDIYTKTHMLEWNAIADGANPKYKIDRTAQVLVYLRERDDARGVAMLHEEVAKLGVDAMVDVVRLPCLNPRPTGSKYSLWTGTMYQFPVIGWAYYGVAAVRRPAAP